jgi:hypothetical protein
MASSASEDVAARRNAREEDAPTTPAGTQLAEQADARNTSGFTLPLIGRIHRPTPDTIVFVLGISLLAALEVVEWPVALVVGIGHTLAHNRQSTILEALGETLEEA